MDTLLFKRAKESLGANSDFQINLFNSKIQDLKIQEKQTLDDKSLQKIEKISPIKKFKTKYKK